MFNSCPHYSMFLGHWPTNIKKNHAQKKYQICMFLGISGRFREIFADFFVLLKKMSCSAPFLRLFVLKLRLLNQSKLPFHNVVTFEQRSMFNVIGKSNWNFFVFRPPSGADGGDSGWKNSQSCSNPYLCRGKISPCEVPPHTDVLNKKTACWVSYLSLNLY